MLGVLGGMGPLATADFLRQVTLNSPADRDQDHIPVVAMSIPQIPDRSDAILSSGPDPLSAMATVLRALEKAGATFIAIPCNTAHHWYDELSARTRLPIIHIVDAVADQLAAEGITDGLVGFIATDGTTASGIYSTNLARRGITAMSAVNQDIVMHGIRLVKAGQIEEASRLFLAEIDALHRRGCQRVVLGCTEIPVALTEVGVNVEGCIDASEALAKSCIQFVRADQRVPAND